MTTSDAFGKGAPGVFLAVPASVPQASVAHALRVLGFDPGVVRGLTFDLDRRGTGTVSAAIDYVDRRDGVARRGLAHVTVLITSDTPNAEHEDPAGT